MAAPIRIQPVESMPLAELVVLRKLMIEGADDDYLKIANHFPEPSRRK